MESNKKQQHGKPPKNPNRISKQICQTEKIKRLGFDIQSPNQEEEKIAFEDLENFDLENDESNNDSRKDDSSDLHDGIQNGWEEAKEPSQQKVLYQSKYKKKSR